ncbi:MAG TPA: efflux RND transporter periplasmic adaptor subunit [Leptospiraceae bacterium]|nr:efflux RND transporter periplasmic adaptor subunit [Leptospiraceae bacterium]HMW04127.1 efflux RND transporter periplasmic adaptor subunit [Leptospiraceae bacterium]HMX30806.1 efflux RND transporter periplasmic adaptor subunit [Leptospiraceae bacterium]HMY30120.1 efflux RND transporter periplasmic adaptor subunit [Leptospiraceae bacterium]HMZ64373.1 efflux RND transporter periplasmic adaptor subunit [Leptospiraceae bacterium]
MRFSTKIFILFLILLFSLESCRCKKDRNEEKKPLPLSGSGAMIHEGGKHIEFPPDAPQINLFQTQKVVFLSYDLNINAPATVIGRIKKAEAPGLPSIILFASPDLTSAYAAYLQNLSLIHIAQTNYNRFKDLADHGAATGKELNDAAAELYNRQSSLAENEAKLRREGFNPKDLQRASRGSVWLISDVPESELNILIEGLTCSLSFPSFPTETFSGKIDAIAEVLNSDTRKARIRIIMHDTKDKIRPGMYGKVQFKMPESGLMIPKKSLVSSNARYYVFIKISPTTFQRREVTISTDTEEFIEIAHGITAGEEIVTTNVFLLKGLSFGI